MNLEILKEKMLKDEYDHNYIDKVASYAENLEFNGHIIIFDIKHLALLSGINSQLLYAHYEMRENQYKEFKIPKKTGGYRKIIAPSENLKYIQKWILDNILNTLNINGFANGFVANRSIITNARKHVGKACVVNIDIKDFFPSITYQEVYSVFIEMGYTRHLSIFFSGMCTHEGVLPQGAPTSPILSNIVCDNLDNRLAELANNINADYTRYADDITFSGNKSIAKYIKLIKTIIRNERFEINRKKLRVHYQHHRQMVTGLIVNEVLSVPKETKRYLRQQIYYSKKHGVTDNLLKQGIFKTNYKEHLYGLAYFIKMVEKAKAKRFIKELDQIDWES